MAWQPACTAGLSQLVCSSHRCKPNYASTINSTRTALLAQARYCKRAPEAWKCQETSGQLRTSQGQKKGVMAVWCQYSMSHKRAPWSSRLVEPASMHQPTSRNGISPLVGMAQYVYVHSYVPTYYLSSPLNSYREKCGQLSHCVAKWRPMSEQVAFEATTHTMYLARPVIALKPYIAFVTYRCCDILQIDFSWNSVYGFY